MVNPNQNRNFSRLLFIYLLNKTEYTSHLPSLIVRFPV